MRIAFLCKRRYMSKDVIDDRYARLYEIPSQLARRGHDVLGLCLGYYDETEGDWLHEAGPGRLRWIARSRSRMSPAALLGYPKQALAILRAFSPDVVIGASDAPHVVFGSWLAGRLGVPYAADLYDNFESFGLSRLPGLIPLFRRAVRNADLVSCTSDALADYVRETYRSNGAVLSLPSTVDKSVFHPRDRAACRRGLALPLDAKLVGTAGGLHSDKGVGVLYKAFDRLQRAGTDAELVLAGPTDGKLAVPSGGRVHYLGLLPHARVAELFAALDIGVIYVRDTPFGRYCFPQKAYEMAACGLTIAAADVGAMHALLAPWPETLYPPDDDAALADILRSMLQRPVRAEIAVEDWEALVARFDEALAVALDSAHR
jgi:glycosyltransferase involved in cell wall biosynthesis